MTHCCRVYWMMTIKKLCRKLNLRLNRARVTRLSLFELNDLERGFTTPNKGKMRTIAVKLSTEFTHRLFSHFCRLQWELIMTIIAFLLYEYILVMRSQWQWRKALNFPFCSKKNQKSNENAMKNLWKFF